MENPVIIGVRKAPVGFKEYVVALVTFRFKTDEFTGPCEITRYQPAKNGKEAKTYVIGTVSGSVECRDVPLCFRSDEDEHPWMMSGAIELPDAVRQKAAELAWVKWSEMEKAKAANPS